MRNIWTITWLTFHEARRRKMVLAALVLGALFILLYDTGLAFVLSQAGTLPIDTPVTSALASQVYSFLFTAGMYVIHFLTIMLTIFAAIDTISGEISTHTIQSIVTKPIRRWEVMVGKYIGYAVMIVPYLAFLMGGLALSLWVGVGYLSPNLLLAFLLLSLDVVLLLSVSLLGGTRFSTLTNGVVLFMLYGLAFIGSWIEQFGSLFQSHAATNVGIVTSLVMPVEAIWSLVAYLIEPPIVHDLPSSFRISPFMGTASVPSQTMVIYAIGYAAVVLLFAIRAFNRRDL
jgi:Cu-processing system permease protein